MFLFERSFKNAWRAYAKIIFDFKCWFLSKYKEIFRKYKEILRCGNIKNPVFDVFGSGLEAIFSFQDTFSSRLGVSWSPLGASWSRLRGVLDTFEKLISLLDTFWTRLHCYICSLSERHENITHCERFFLHCQCYCTQTHKHTYTHSHMCTHTRAHANQPTHPQTHTHTHANTHTHILSRVRTYRDFCILLWRIPATIHPLQIGMHHWIPSLTTNCLIKADTSEVCFESLSALRVRYHQNCSDTYTLESCGGVCFVTFPSNVLRL